jgi:mono/diheme cytochrome c family protein
MAALVPPLVLLPGCGGDTYSEAMIYPVRVDPIINETPPREVLEPDRPGQLPLFTLKDVEDIRNPFYTDYKDKVATFKVVDPTKLAPVDRDELQETLQDLFGTPAHPKVELISAETRNILQLDEGTLKQGSRLYRLHCLQCHGLTGDGRGPTAKWVNPHPRDYRKGLFKFQSVDQVAGGGELRPPRREDLIRTLYEGVEGTAMQSYNMLPESELNALVSYIVHLSIRGEVEEAVFKEAVPDSQTGMLDTKSLPRGSIAGYLRGKRGAGGKVRDIAEKWRDANEDDRKVKVGPYKFKEPGPHASQAEKDAFKEAFDRSIQNGYDIFVGRGPVSGGCTQCHYDFGRKSLFKFDVWGTMVRPRDLTKSVYRGGRRPVDLYYRIHSGINGSGMLKQGGLLTPDQIWDVVNFVRALPYSQMRKDLKPAID